MAGIRVTPVRPLDERRRNSSVCNEPQDWASRGRGVLSAIQPPMANRKRVQVDQVRLLSENLLERLPRQALLLRVRSVTAQYLAAYRLSPESRSSGDMDYAPVLTAGEWWNGFLLH